MIVKTVNHKSGGAGGRGTRTLAEYICNKDDPDEKAIFLCSSDWDCSNGEIPDPNKIQYLLDQQHDHKTNNRSDDLLHVILRSDHDNISIEEWKEIAKATVAKLADKAIQDQSKDLTKKGIENPRSTYDDMIFVATLHEHKSEINSTSEFHLHIVVARNTKNNPETNTKSNYISSLNLWKKCGAIRKELENEFCLRDSNNPDALNHSKSNRQRMKDGKEPKLNNFTHIQFTIKSLIDEFKDQKQKPDFEEFKKRLASEGITVKKFSNGMAFHCTKYPVKKTKNNKGEPGWFKATSLCKGWNLKYFENYIDFKGAKNDIRTNEQAGNDASLKQSDRTNEQVGKRIDNKQSRKQQIESSIKSTKRAIAATAKIFAGSSKPVENNRKSRAEMVLLREIKEMREKLEELEFKQKLNSLTPEKRELLQKESQGIKQGIEQKQMLIAKTKDNRQLFNTNNATRIDKALQAIDNKLNPKPATQSQSNPVSKPLSSGISKPTHTASEPITTVQPLGRAKGIAPVAGPISEVYKAKDNSPEELAKAAASQQAVNQAMAAYQRQLDEFMWEQIQQAQNEPVRGRKFGR